MVIPRGRVREFLRGQPEFAVRVIEKLIRRSRALTASVKNLALLDVYGRVAQTLQGLAVEQSGRFIIERRVTHQDIASMVGASREMVNRILKDLTDRGCISIESKSITIINREFPPSL